MASLPKTGSISIKAPMGGWTPQQYGTIPIEGQVNPQTGTSNQYSQSTNVSLHRGNFIGHITAGPIFSAIPDTNGYLTGLPISAVSTSDANNTYFAVENDASLVAFTANGTTAHWVLPSTMSGLHSGMNNVIVGNDHDVLWFEDINRKSFVLWSWESQAANSPYLSGGDIAIIPASGTNSSGMNLNYNFFSSLTAGVPSGSSAVAVGGILTGNVPHMLAQNAVGNIYCTNGQYIASIAGVNSAAVNMVSNTQAVNLGLGWVAMGMTTYGNYLAIVAQRDVGVLPTLALNSPIGNRNKSRVFLWDGASIAYNFMYEIDDFTATSIVNKEGVLYILTGGQDGKTRVQMLNMYNKWEEVFGYYNQTIGVTPANRSADIVRGMLVWPNSISNTLNTYEPGGGFHQEIFPSTSTTAPTSIGMVRNLEGSGTGLYVGATISSTNYILRIDETKYMTNGTWYSNLIELPYKSTVKKVKVFFSKFVAGSSSVQVALFSDYTTGNFGSAADLLSATVTSTTYPNVATDMSVSIPKTIKGINSCYLGLKFNHATVSTTAAAVREIIVEYESPSMV